MGFKDIDDKRVREKIAEIGRFLDEFYSIMPDDFRTYQSDLKEKAACERYIEKIVEASVDLSFFIIKFKSLSLPDDDKQAFERLNDANIITDNTCLKMKQAKGMRNIIVHVYGNIDDEIVFETLTKELIPDVRSFLVEVENSLEEQDEDE